MAGVGWLACNMSAATAATHVRPGRFAIARLADGPRLRYVLGVVLLAALYYGAAHLGYALEFAGPVAAILWLPVGVGIAFLYLRGIRYWPGVLLGDLVANDYTALPLGSALGQTCGNVLEVLTATLVMRRLIRHGSPVTSVPNLGRMLLALALGTALSATIGTLSSLLGSVVAAGDLPEVWRTWWLGDFSGALVVVPLAVAWSRPAQPEQPVGRAPEAVLLLAAVVALSELSFSSGASLSYMVFPALVWAALRFGQRGATVAIVAAVGYAVWNTTHAAGPFAFESVTRSVLATQLFIAVAALTTLCLGAVASERETFARRLRASRGRLVEAGDTQRRRFEHDLHDGAQQRLTALAARLDLSAEQAQQDPALAAALFEEAGTELSLAIDELRELAHGIHPAALHDLGLASAMGSVAARSTVPIRLLQVPVARLDRTVEATAYYLFAEAITNAQKHARASAIEVRVAVMAGDLRIVVADDGVGGAAEGTGSGLQGLRDRVEAIGGTFAVDSPAGRGTRIAAAVPIGAPEPPPDAR
jgi:signal transduction histidine kinase